MDCQSRDAKRELVALSQALRQHQRVALKLVRKYFFANGGVDRVSQRRFIRTVRDEVNTWGDAYENALTALAQNSWYSCWSASCPRLDLSGHIEALEKSTHEIRSLQEGIAAAFRAEFGGDQREVADMLSEGESLRGLISEELAKVPPFVNSCDR
jgi:hypothetical protein